MNCFEYLLEGMLLSYNLYVDVLIPSELQSTKNVHVSEIIFPNFTNKQLLSS